MGKLRRKLLTTTMIPAVVGLGSVMAFDASACMCQRKAAAKAYTMALENPEAVADPATGMAAGCGGCGGCGGGGCGGCGVGCGACNPCASECEEDPCNPCAVCEDPCGASLETATGLAAGCGGCGGCGGGGCGGCGVGCGACNPCASECEEDPCNPCAVCEDPCGASLETATGLAAGCGGCGGCGGGGCGGCGVGCGACNPCASECEEDPCNPCAVCEDPCGASLETATGLAAGCGGCGGCGGGGCGGCGVGCGACNPCASECEEDPCNPCAVCEDPCGASLETATGLAAGCGGCGGCGGGGCGGCGVGCGACNPCASECEEDPCNPCAVCEDPCGASLWQPDDATGVAWNVLTGEPSAAYVAGLLPHGDVPATFDWNPEHGAILADEGIGVVGASATDSGSRFVPDGTASDGGHWRYTLSVS